MITPIDINAANLRLRKRNWIELSDVEQRAVLVAAELAHNSDYIPIIAGEVIKHFDSKRTPEHPQPEYVI